MKTPLTAAQLRAIGHMQESATIAGREMRRIARLALENNLNVGGVNLDEVTRVYRELRRNVLEHMAARAAEQSHVEPIHGLDRRAA